MRLELIRFTNDAKGEEALDDETLEQTANSWWAEESNLLFGAGESPEKVAANSNFQQYCDSKIFELGTNSYFANRVYSKRPTPLAFCEPYYMSQGYFEGETCADSSGGQHYFSCIWGEGIRKTPLYADLYASFDDGEKATMDGFFATETIETIRKVIALDENTLVFCPSRIRVCSWKRRKQEGLLLLLHP